MLTSYTIELVLIKKPILQSYLFHNFKIISLIQFLNIIIYHLKKLATILILISLTS